MMEQTFLEEVKDDRAEWDPAYAAVRPKLDFVVELVKLRYRARPVACRLDGETVELAEPVDGAAPGQAAVLMAGDRVLGIATIA